MESNMIKRYKNLGFVFGVPGLVLQVVGNLMLSAQPRSGLGFVVGLGGTVLLLTGFSYYAKAKGRHPAWCLMAFLSCFGPIIWAFLKDKSNQVGAGQPAEHWQRTTSDRPFVIQNPVAGFLNLQGDRGKALLESDIREFALFFSDCRTSASDVPRCQVLFVYCDIDPSGRIQGTPDPLRALAMWAGAYVTIVATANDMEAYKKTLEAKVDWTSNIVLVLDRKDSGFSNFFCRLFEMMNKGTSMLMAWVKLAPQGPGQGGTEGPASVLLAEAGHVTFGRTS
jgi:hypothetical protein